MSIRGRRGTVRAKLAGIMAADRLQIDEETGLPVYRAKAKERYMPYVLSGITWKCIFLLL